MSAPEQNVETATDPSSDREAREEAIETLEAANECDRLANLALTADLEAEYRERALTALGHPQCRTKLRQLVDGGELPESLRSRAESLLEETPDDAGAGP